MYELRIERFHDGKKQAEGVVVFDNFHDCAVVMAETINYMQMRKRYMKRLGEDTKVKAIKDHEDNQRMEVEEALGDWLV